MKHLSNSLVDFMPNSLNFWKLINNQLEAVVLGCIIENNDFTTFRVRHLPLRER
jgi:hypothetical protein